jgi:hypothetical protein
LSGLPDAFGSALGIGARSGALAPFSALRSAGRSTAATGLGFATSLGFAFELRLCFGLAATFVFTASFGLTVTFGFAFAFGFESSLLEAFDLSFDFAGRAGLGLRGGGFFAFAFWRGAGAFFFALPDFTAAMERVAFLGLLAFLPLLPFAWAFADFFAAMGRLPSLLPGRYKRRLCRVPRGKW